MVIVQCELSFFCTRIRVHCWRRRRTQRWKDFSNQLKKMDLLRNPLFLLYRRKMENKRYLKVVVTTRKSQKSFWHGMLIAFFLESRTTGQSSPSSLRILTLMSLPYRFFNYASFFFFSLLVALLLWFWMLPLLMNLEFRKKKCFILGNFDCWYFRKFRIFKKKLKGFQYILCIHKKKKKNFQ